MKAKDRFCIWSQIKNEAHNLKEFIEWHLSQGFEYFVFGDDESVDNPREVLQPYIEAGVVLLYDATMHSENYGRFVGKTYFMPNDIVAFIDVDELVTSISGFAISELREMFTNPDVSIVYLNWCLRNSGTLESTALRDWRDDVNFSLPDSHTKYVVRISAIIGLEEAAVSTHHAPGISRDSSRNGAGELPQFIVGPDAGRNGIHELINCVSPWQIPPSNVKIKIEHFYSKSFDKYLNFKAVVGNKFSASRGKSFHAQIRGMKHYQHGLGSSVDPSLGGFVSINSCRIYPQLVDNTKMLVGKPSSEKRQKVLYLHMGLPKTGTTAFQKKIAAYSLENHDGKIGYVRLSGTRFEKHEQNGLDLVTPAREREWKTLESVLRGYCSEINSSEREIFVISAEGFSATEAAQFGMIKKVFNDNYINVCGIAVLRPFIEFSISFFKQYVKMACLVEEQNMLSYEQIAESARIHIQNLAINSMMCDDFKTIEYSSDNMTSKILDFIYENDLDSHSIKNDEFVNVGMTWEAAEAIYRMCLSRTPEKESSIKEFLEIQTESVSTVGVLEKESLFYDLLIQERVKLRQFLMQFPFSHRWSHLFSEDAHECCAL
jgi:hypothetical protein